MKTKIAKSIKIIPNDGLFFGERKSFDAGESNWINSRNMPYPSVFYGAIFAILYSENPDKIKKEVDTQKTDEDLYKFLEENLEIKDIYICKDGERIIKIPLDIYLDKNCKQIMYGAFGKNPLADLDELEYLLFPPQSNKVLSNDNNFYMYKYQLYKYENKYKDNIEIIKDTNIFKRREKIGIQLNKNGTAEEGKLYRINYSYFKDENYYFQVDFNIKADITIPKKGFMKLGGEGKTCVYEVKNREIKNKETIPKGNYKIVLTSPAILQNNLLSTWKPDFGQDVEVKGAVIRGKEYIGGFDQRKGKEKEKAIKIGVPEGSVFKVEVNKNIDKLEMKNGYHAFKGFNKFIIVKEK
ncbi:type III-B CRISPR module-associated protein Cmr3 [Clostridium oceanicum]|uniref:Type III-B CRISPR module-associated protein Cmr3 n=1 Tax=Clostridium oceanicum TaxID=1543 RepID=A0ABP3US07_9CLOT